jgi:hypothetical protein
MRNLVFTSILLLFMAAMVACPAVAFDGTLAAAGEANRNTPGGRELLEDTAFSEGFGASWNYGRKFTLHPRRREGKATEYRDISPWTVHLIPDGPVNKTGVKEHPWDFEEGLHHNFTDRFGRQVGELHAHRLVVNHRVEVNTPEKLQFAQYNNYGLKPDDPTRNSRLVKRITTDRRGSIRLYYNTQNEIRNAATEHSAKWARDTWPHLLLNQTFDTLPRLQDMERMDLKLDFCVHQIRRLSSWPGVNRSSINFKFMFFLRGIDDPDQKLFAGMMLQSSRARNYPIHVGVDQHGTVFYRDSIAEYRSPPEPGERCTIHREIKSLIRDALRAAKLKQPELSGDPKDYYLFNFSIGWEGLGHWLADGEISNLSLVALPAAKPEFNASSE